MVRRRDPGPVGRRGVASRANGHGPGARRRARQGPRVATANGEGDRAVGASPSVAGIDVIARPDQLADPLWGLDLSRPRTRWAILRAGGWAGDVDEIIGWYESQDPTTGAVSRKPIMRFVERRDRSKECRRGLGECYRLRCMDSGRCEGAAAEGLPQHDVEPLAIGCRPQRPSGG